jgi:nucleotide-binding universal stress UspA family protein
MVVRRSPGHGEHMTILAAFDPQTRDLAPVRFAVAAAKFADVPLVLASVRASVAPAPSAQGDVIGEELERLRGDITYDHGIEVRTRTVKALPPVGVTRALQNVVDEEHASLVVVGSSKRGLVGQVVPGTTAQRVISGSACPVVVVPRGYDAPKQLTTIGVAFAPTPEGRRALHEAAIIAARTDADLRVLTVMKPWPGADASAGATRRAAEPNRAQLEGTLTAAIAELDDGVPAEGEVLVGDPADALVNVSQHLDLLVMGSRGYAPGLAVLLGGVSRRITMKARCPVLVVPRRSTKSLAPWTHRTVTTVCKTYASEAIARDAVDTLTAGGVPRHDIWLLTGHRIHDIRHENVGGFAGAVEPSSPVGTYAGAVRLRRQGAGAFTGDPDQQRQGSFADAEIDTIITYEDRAGRSHVGGPLELQSLLRRFTLTDEEAARVIHDLHTGRAVVLVRGSQIAASDARARLDELAHAA